MTLTSGTPQTRPGSNDSDEYLPQQTHRHAPAAATEQTVDLR